MIYGITETSELIIIIAIEQHPSPVQVSAQTFLTFFPPLNTQPLTSMGPIFPLEIFNLILDELEVDQINQKRNLHSCSLVCRTFHRICRPHIFKELNIQLTANPVSSKAALWRLLEVLNSNPELKDHVKSIACSQAGVAAELDLADSELTTLLSLPNVDSLDIVSNGEAINYENCRSDKFGCRALLEHYLASRKLTSLYVGRFKNPPIALILTSETLLELALEELDIKLRGFRPIPSQFHNNPLQVLDCHQVIFFPFSVIRYFPSLESIYIAESSSDYFIDIGRLIPSGSRAIVPQGHFQLGRLRSLTSLSDLIHWGGILREGNKNGVKAFPALNSLDVNLDCGCIHAKALLDGCQVLETLQVTSYTSMYFVGFPLHHYIGDMHNTLKTLTILITRKDMPDKTFTTLFDGFLSQSRYALECLTLGLAFRVYPVQPHMDDDIPSMVRRIVNDIREAWLLLVALLEEEDRLPRLKHVNLDLECYLQGITEFALYGDEIFEACLTEAPLRDGGLNEPTTRRFELHSNIKVVRLEGLWCR
ncbi:hypothetical protein BJ165DRAFT_1452260 [Panaeolus papilionaceus]|nr:hypothetical protein BJ165DRAFT_1452260 [Panaeolus papilionaceus]